MAREAPIPRTGSLIAWLGRSPRREGSPPGRSARYTWGRAGCLFTPSEPTTERDSRINLAWLSVVRGLQTALRGKSAIYSGF
jgi:hypothetical protein